MRVEQAENEQDVFEKYLNKIRIGSKSQGQRKTLANFNTLCNGRKNVVKFLKDYSSIILDVKKTPKGKGNKISTPKQIL